MAEKDQYSPDVYKRLELVRKQFKNNAAKQKKQYTAERNQRIIGYLRKNKAVIVRLTVFSILGIVLIAVIVTFVTR